MRDVDFTLPLLNKKLRLESAWYDIVLHHILKYYFFFRCFTYDHETFRIGPRVYRKWAYERSFFLQSPLTHEIVIQYEHHVRSAYLKGLLINFCI